MEIKPHLGRKITRIRELRGMKQEALAQALGVSQQTVSNLENSEEIEDVRLSNVAEALGVSLEGLKNFSDEAMIQVINNTFSDFKDNASAINHNCSLNFNPVDKLVELYERLVQAEKEKVAYLEKLLNR